MSDNPSSSWPAVASESGWSDTSRAKITAVADSQETDCVMVIEAGQVVYSYGDLERKYLCHSIRKSFLAALIGEDVRRGTIRLDAKLAELDIDDHEDLSPVEKHATVYDLLTARSGIYHPAGYETDWMRLIKEKRHSHAPGTFWCYNNWDFNALGTIFTNAAGLSVAQAFADRIAAKVGMEDFSLAGERPDAWVETFDISQHAAYPFRMSTRDLARFGQLCLQGGSWNGEWVLPEGWIEESVAPYSHAGPHGAYGFMWWLERDGVFAPGVRVPRGSYAAMGAGGHYCMVVPERDLVIVHRVDTEKTGTQVSRFGFGHLLRAILAASAEARN